MASLAGAGAVESFLLAAQEAGAGLHPLDRALALAQLTGEGQGVADWPIARRDRLLLLLAGRLFGDVMPCLATCPDCGEAQEFDLSAQAAAEAIAAPGEEQVTVGPWRAKLAPVTSRDLAALVRSASGGAIEALAARAVAITGADGAAASLAGIDDESRREIIERLETREASGELLLALECAQCGHHWSERFDIAGWLWERIEAAGRAVVSEIAALARAFGWTEREILALPRRRRLAYLERAAG